MPTIIEMQLHGFTHGGEAVGRLPSGKACFVPYAIPGERVRVAMVEERKRWARARLVEVVEASSDRIDPPCPYFGPGRCGGCRLQHVSAQRQAALKRQVVVEQLVRLGGIADPPVAPTVTVGSYGYRARARFAVDPQGRLGFRRASSHDIVPIDRCLLLTEEAQALREAAGDDWGGVAEVEVRTGGAGGRTLVVHPGPGPVAALPEADAAVALVDAAGDAVALRGDPAVHERVAGVDLLVGPVTFAQANRAGAEALAGLVRAAAGARHGTDALDLYAGAGLFTVALRADGARVTAVEARRAAAADLAANTAGDPGVEVVHADAAAEVARRAAAGVWADVVVLDPPRSGAGSDAVRNIAALAPHVIVYVACDPAALARDARALASLGYSLSRAVPVDQFAQTAQIEVVATFLPAVPVAPPPGRPTVEVGA